MRWVCLGASSGLGLSVVQELLTKPNSHILSISRKARDNQIFANQSSIESLQFDFSKENVWPEILNSIKLFKPDRVVYFAGGGPYGFFSEKKFSSHQWAWKVTFEFPAFLLHSLLADNINSNAIENENTWDKEKVEMNHSEPKNLSQKELSQKRSQKIVCFIGSSIAEAKPDPGAASYAAAKHALKGLIQSVQSESEELLKKKSLHPQKNLEWTIKLFSPGYMDTRMLPPQSWPRQVSGLVKDPKDVSIELLQFLESNSECFVQ